VSADVELTDFAAPCRLAHAHQRPADGGDGRRIPLASMRRDATRFGFDGEDAEETFARMMWAMDDVYLAWLNEEQRERQELGSWDPVSARSAMTLLGTMLFGRIEI
jgi:hypothetical protein